MATFTDTNVIGTETHDVSVGKQYQYHEDSDRFIVAVLADRSNEKWIKLALRIVRNIRRPGTDEGEEFEAVASRGEYAYSGMWRIYDEDFPPGLA
jgi:hypothetical protein